MRKTSLYLLATPTASRKKATLFTCILALLFSVLSIAWSAKLNPAEANTIIYVNQNASGSNNGTTWKNAYTDLQTALAAASSGDEIWVAAGIYVPGTNSFSSFSLVDGVAVYGGFDASETVRAQRDWVNNITILSGDVGGDDTTDSNGVVLDPDDVVGTNIRNIVVGSNLTAATVLDGFTITAGNDAFSGGTASGLALNSSSPTVQNIHFIGNKGLLGGGLSMSNSSSPQIADIIIENNLANSRGGGIYIDNSSPTIQNVSIIGNESLSQGGGIYSVGSVITLTNIAVQGNSTTIDGGGIFLATGDNSVLDNILISGNIASNNSGSEGGGLHIFDSDVTISNLTIVGNFASLGGGIANNFGTLNLNNSIVWGNDDNGSNPETASSYENFNASTNIQFSTVESINTFQNSGNNSGSDPLFASTINASDAPTTTGDFQLQSGSPAIDAGSSALYTSASNTDLAGNTRINGSAIDMGVYESNFIPLSLAIDGSGSGSVSATGINCPSDCEEGYAPNTVVTLTATADTGSNFITWSGASGCSNNRVCAVTMDSAKNITATIDLKNYTLGAAIIPANGGTVTSSPTGISCPGDCSEVYQWGNVITLTASAANGYEFMGWGGGVTCSGTGLCVVTIDDARLARADFSPVYTLTTSLTGVGLGVVSSTPAGINCGATCSMSAVDGTIVELNASPSPNSIFTGWSGGGCSGTGSCSVTLDASKAVSANFEPAYDLTVNQAGSGSGDIVSTPSGINCGATCIMTAQSGTTITLTATATSGSEFTSWSGSGCAGTGNCVVSLSAAETVTATFMQLFALSVSKTGDGDGTVTSAPSGIDCGSICSVEVTDGTSVTLTATADGQSAFTGWSGGGCSGLGTCTVLVDQAKNVTANFVPVYTLTVVPAGDGNGAITDTTNSIDCVPVCSMTATSGTQITLTATASTGSIFTGWSGGGCIGESPICSLSLNASETVTATFAQLFEVDIAKDGSGAGSVSSIPTAISCGLTCTAQVASGTMMTLTATANSGSIFDGWNGEGCSGTGVCVLPITASRSVTATFTDSPTARDLTVTILGDGDGVVTSSPAGIDCGTTCAMSVADGTTVTLTAAAASGSIFTGWSGGGCSGTASCVVTLNASQAVTATFEQEVVSGGNLIYLPITVRP